MCYICLHGLLGKVVVHVLLRGAAIAELRGRSLDGSNPAQGQYRICHSFCWDTWDGYMIVFVFSHL
jgi:hypothetical protein